MALLPKVSLNLSPETRSSGKQVDWTVFKFTGQGSSSVSRSGKAAVFRSEMGTHDDLGQQRQGREVQHGL